MMWLILKPATMRHYLQSLLLHGNTLQNLKIIFTKPKFLFGIYFHKAQIPIWHYFTKPKFLFGTILQSPNTNLTLFYKAQLLFWQFFHKAQILIWQLSHTIFIKAQVLIWHPFYKA